MFWKKNLFDGPKGDRERKREEREREKRER